MGRTTKPLSNSEIQKSRAIDKELSLYDGDGLYVLIKPSGRKLWRFRYQRPNSEKRTVLGLGTYPHISLADARSIRHEYLTLLAKGIDPQAKAAQQEEQAEIAEESRFINVAKKWFEFKKKSITEDYAKDIWRSLEKDVLPCLENMAITEIKARTLIQVLEPIKTRGALETVRRLSQRINEIMIYAINTGLLEANPASTISQAFEKPKKQNSPTVRPEILPQLMRDISMSNLQVTTRALLLWQLITLVRPSEAAGTKWVEIDFENKLWNIPAERMKAKKAHTVPLSNEALGLLAQLKPLNPQTANAALKRIGYGGQNWWRMAYVPSPVPP